MMNHSPLSQLFLGYLHQDWIVVYGSIEAVVADFVRSQTDEDVREAINELDVIIGADYTEAELARLASELECEYWPYSEGKTYTDWFPELLSALTFAREREHSSDTNTQ